MLGTQNFWTFMVASFLLWITPGPDTLYILARSAAQGPWAGVLSALGIGTGVIFHTVLAAFGLSALLATSVWAFTVFKLIGACYLIVLGVKALRPTSAPSERLRLSPMGRWQMFRQGFITNALNPKVAAFFLAFLPQFVDPTAGLGPVPFAMLGAAYGLGATIYCILLAFGAAMASGAFRRHPRVARWLERGAGSVYIALGVHLLRQRPQE
jgi:threonine/homoserine/homoserine lactone efflux protein